MLVYVRNAGNIPFYLHILLLWWQTLSILAKTKCADKYTKPPASLLMGQIPFSS